MPLPLDKINLDKRLMIKLPSLKSVLINLFLGLVIGYLGPFGSFETTLQSRLVYWVLVVFSGHFIYFNVIQLVAQFFKSKNVHPVIPFFISSLVSALLFSFVVIYISSFFFDLQFDATQSFKFFFPKVFILGTVINIVRIMVNNFYELAHSAPKDVPVTADNLFLRRLPKKIGTELICFSMEDHYLHVHTDEGSHMMLLRMKDALVELEEYAGFQVHRSWWVASNAIVDVKREPRKATLIMKNEMAVPVSQKYLPVLKEKGLQ